MMGSCWCSKKTWECGQRFESLCKSIPSDSSLPELAMMYRTASGEEECTVAVYFHLHGYYRTGDFNRTIMGS